MRNAFLLTTALCTFVAPGILGVQAWAADAASATASADTTTAAPAAFDEIVVTARKREENLQSVPIAITAFSPKDLEDKNVQTLSDLKFVAPSLSVQPDTFRQDTINITIRGIRNFPGSGVQFDTAAAVYVNGIYYARTQGLTGAFFDVQNVQVLKGPQGTLVGRNATGGAVLYTTNDPGPDFGGAVQTVIGDYGRHEAQAILNVPLTDRIFVRAAWSYTEQEGFLRNEYFNPTTGERNTAPGLGSRKNAGVFSVRFDPDDESKLILRGTFDFEHFTGSSYHLITSFQGTNTSTGNIGSNPAPVVRPSICQIPTTCGQLVDLKGRVIDPYYSNVNTLTVNTASSAYNSLFNVLNRQKSDFWLIDQADSGYNTGAFQSVSGSYDRNFGDISLKVVGGYRWFETYALSVSRGAPYDTIDTRNTNPDYRAWTGEATLNGKLVEDKLDWTTGFFYFRENSGDQTTTSYLFSTNQLQPQQISGRQVTGANNAITRGVNTGYAPYAQATYKVLPEFRITGGVRYSIDERYSYTAQPTYRFPATAVTTAAVANAVFVPGPYVFNGITYQGATLTCSLTNTAGVLLAPSACSRDASATYRQPTWTASADYDIADRTLVYATVRRGYKSGALDASNSNPVFVAAKPEKVQDYEIGIKSDWYLGDIPFRTNFDAYRSDFHDVQTQVSLPNITQATGPGGTGTCTQDLYNGGQCLGVQTNPITLNADLARIYGAEWDVSMKPVPEWTVSWNGSYMHAKYINFSFTVPAGYLQPASGSSLAGKYFQLPAWSMAGSTTYTLTGEQLGGLPVENVSLTYNVFWQSDYLTDLAIYNAAQKVKGYAISGLRLGIENVAKTNLNISGTLSNLFNRRACQGEPGGTSGGSGVIGSTPNSTFGVPGTSGLVQCVPVAPRMFALTAKYRF